MNYTYLFKFLYEIEIYRKVTVLDHFTQGKNKRIKLDYDFRYICDQN